MAYFDKEKFIDILNAKADMAVGAAKRAFLSVSRMLEKLPDADVGRVEHWISVKDKLPENDSHVLVAFDDGYMATVDYTDDWELWADSGEPTHWQPLPEPPKERNV